MISLTSKSIAQKYEVSVITVRKWAKNNNVQKFGRDFIFNEIDLQNFLNRNTQRGRPKK